MFCPIVLLNTLGKLFEKMIARQLQWESQEFRILHPCQFGGVRQNSTEDAGAFLTHVIRVGWQQKKVTSIIAFDLVQYFPSLNHEVLAGLLERFRFPSHVVRFFDSYLTQRTTRYSWNGVLSEIFGFDVGVGQSSALSPILSALYLAPLLWNFNKEMPGATLMSYVDDGIIIVSL